MSEKKNLVKISKKILTITSFRAYLTVVDGFLVNNSFILPKHCVNPDFRQSDIDLRAPFILPKHCVNPDLRQSDIELRALGEIRLSYTVKSRVLTGLV